MPGLAVPGAPVVVSVQNSAVMPHWPQTSQQVLSGHGLRLEMLAVPLAGASVPELLRAAHGVGQRCWHGRGAAG